MVFEPVGIQRSRTNGTEMEKEATEMEVEMMAMMVDEGGGHGCDGDGVMEVEVTMEFF
jgi:hypothetical protein